MAEPNIYLYDTEDIDLKDSTKITLEPCKQFDDITLSFNILNDGVAVDLTSYTIDLRVLKSDNTFVIQDTNITKTTNNIKIECIRDITRVSGKAKCELRLVDNNSKQKTSFDFIIPIKPSIINDKSVESGNIVTVIEKLNTSIDIGNTLDSVLKEDISIGTQLDTELDTDINTGNILKNILIDKIAEGNALDEALELTTTNANTKKTELEGTISTANTSKTNLENATAIADTKKTELNASIDIGNTLDGVLKDNIQTGIELDTDLDETISIGTQLNTDLNIAIPIANTSKTNLETATTNANNKKTELENTTATADAKNTELNTSVANAQDDINAINARGNDSFTILSTDWVGTEPDLTYNLNHGLNSKNIIVSAINDDTKFSSMPDFKYIDMNNIEIQSTIKSNITVSINANYYSGKDANIIAQEVIDARGNESNLKGKLDGVDETLVDHTSQLAEIVQSGTNANGNYIRFADGTQICYRDYNDVTGISVPAGTNYIVGDLIYPAQFISNPITFAMGLPTNANGNISGVPLLVWGSSKFMWQGISFNNFSAITITQVLYIKVFAIGRWK